MIKCPNSDCTHENVDGTAFCEVCGEELPTAAPAAAHTGDLVTCPSCGEKNPADYVVCEACGADLKPAAAHMSTPDDVTNVPPAAHASPAAEEITPFDTPAPVAATTEPAATGSGLSIGQVRLVVEQGQTVGAQFVLGDAESLVGREDEEEEIYPDIDLSDQDAGYVHRKHATLNFTDTGLTVTHLGGANKTRVNNKPIPDHTPTPVNLGDKLAFGKVVLRVLAV